ALAASRLASGATLHMATDWTDYADQMREVADAEPLLHGGAVPRPPWRPLTKFEQRAEREGREVRDMIYQRVDDPARR
ncbi:MAG: tRNA ((7)-)-methyltransferase, partial [Pseudonocardia sp.]|nr:tRNA ((7)-)-methyltransferase [Pseudonocardia sp.]